MTRETYSRVKAVFQGAVELAPEAWKTYLDEHCADEPEVRREVEKLLRHHRAETVLIQPERPTPDEPSDSPPTTMRFVGGEAAEEAKRRHDAQRRMTIGVVAACAVMLGVGIVLFFLVRSSLQETLRSGFEALVLQSAGIAGRHVDAQEGGDLDEMLLGEELQELLKLEIGETGDVYLFDQDGRKCSGGRFEAQELTGWKFPPILRGELPQVADSGPGSDMVGYRSYHGAEVVGAWVWIGGELNRGVVVEAQTSQVYAPLKYILIAFVALLVLLLVLSGLAFHSSRRAESLEQTVAEGERLGQYTLIERIGEGGLGVVYRARHARLRRPTAVKLLKSEAVTPPALRRFEREVQQTAELTHPNTIAVYDYGRSESGTFYYAMEYLSGITVGELLAREGKVPLARTLYILRQLLGSLEEAHGVGLIHRDVKPANVMINHRGGRFDVVKVLDFGLAKEIDPGPESDITERGLVGGTALYIAPERLAESGRPDGRSDLYAVGVMAFLMLTGREPYGGETPVEICAATIGSPVPRVSDDWGEVPPRVDGLVFDCMAKDPKDRPASAAKLEALLAGIQADHPWSQEEAVAWWEKAEARDGS